RPVLARHVAALALRASAADDPPPNLFYRRARHSMAVCGQILASAGGNDTADRRSQTRTCYFTVSVRTCTPAPEPRPTMTTPIHHRTHGRRGSALGITMLLVFALTLIVGAILRTLVLDKRLNAGYAIAGEARNAAEGAAEVAVAELNRRAAAYSSLGDNPLDSFTFPEDARTFLGGGNIVSGSIAFKAGQLSPMP